MRKLIVFRGLLLILSTVWIGSFITSLLPPECKWYGQNINQLPTCPWFVQPLYFTILVFALLGGLIFIYDLCTKLEDPEK